MSLSVDPPVDYHDQEGGKEARKKKGRKNEQKGRETYILPNLQGD